MTTFSTTASNRHRLDTVGLPQSAAGDLIAYLLANGLLQRVLSLPFLPLVPAVASYRSFELGIPGSFCGRCASSRRTCTIAIAATNTYTLVRSREVREAHGVSFRHIARLSQPAIAFPAPDRIRERGQRSAALFLVFSRSAAQKSRCQSTFPGWHLPSASTLHATGVETASMPQGGITGTVLQLFTTRP